MATIDLDRRLFEWREGDATDPDLWARFGFSEGLPEVPITLIRLRLAPSTADRRGGHLRQFHRSHLLERDVLIAGRNA
jgi:hypothetical protein